MIPPLELAGKEFGTLTVIERAPRPEGKKRIGSWWRCRCTCGAESVVTGDRLQAGTAKCNRHRGGRPGASGAHAIFCNYRFSARKRKIPFEITKEQLLSLTSRDCSYCGAPPSSPSRCGGNSTPETHEKSLYLYNGIDRVDNTRGYMIDNCVPCCKQCNRAKSNMTVEEFYQWIAAVHGRAPAPFGTKPLTITMQPRTYSLPRVLETGRDQR